MNSPEHNTPSQEELDKARKERNSQCSILLVEDDPALRGVLKNVLEMQGFNVLETDTRLGASRNR